MKKQTYKNLIIVFAIPVLLSYIHIWKDYSHSIELIAKPMRDNVLMFKEKYGYYPTDINESLNLLKLSGCNDVNGKIGSTYDGEKRMVYKCKFWVKNMSMHAVINRPTKPYSLSFYMGYTRCHIKFRKTNRAKIRCYQDPLIKFSA